MSGWMSYFTGKKDTTKTTRDAIVTLRQQLTMLEKKEEYLQKKIEEEIKKAKANAISNKAVATAALRRKKAHEAELERLSGTRLTLETQVNAIESANINATTMEAMKKGADALKVVHDGLTLDKVDKTMDAIREQIDLSNEISKVISDPTVVGLENDEDELAAELAELEQEKLDEVLAGAEPVPVHAPAGSSRVEVPKQQVAVEDDEERELRELQASLAM
ncbi:ESCRT-III subunit protein snf7 [Tulasnella sp. 419]|nr:ESCRT-III subunit protein snf7 [Tulasnella sp. 419]